MFRRNVLTSSPQGNYLINCHFDVLNGIPMDRGDVSQTLICTVGAICSLASSGLMYQTQKCLHIHVNITDNKRTLQKTPSSFFPSSKCEFLDSPGYGLKKPVSYWAVGTSSDVLTQQDLPRVSDVVRLKWFQSLLRCFHWLWMKFREGSSPFG